MMLAFFEQNPSERRQMLTSGYIHTRYITRPRLNRILVRLDTRVGLVG